MASTHKHIRSSTANKRPTTAIADGQIALNTNASSPGLFFKDSTGASIIKIGPVHVGSTAPNATPGAGGSSGNSTGEIWLDNSLTPVGVKIWNGSAWVNATPAGSTTVQGLLELATSAETQTGTDTDRAVTPAGLQSKLSDSTSTTSSTTIASSTAVKSAYDLANAALPKSGGTITGNLEIGTTGSLSFEGSTADAFETTIAVTDPTADRTITLPDTTGTIVTTGDTGTVTGTMIASGTVTSSNIVDGTIVDADISASAEIAVSKLADGAARQLLQTDAAGTGVEWASNIDIPGTLDVTSAATFDSTIGASAGTASLPSITFTGDLNTGIYSPGADQVAISTNGSGRLFVDASGRIGIGTSVTSAGRLTAQAVDDTATGGISLRGFSDGSANGDRTIFIDALSQLGNYRANINYSAWQHIFTANAQERLRITSTGALNFVGAGTAGSTQAVSFNGSAPVNSLVIDSSGRLGIGTSSPGQALDVVGTIQATASTATGFNRVFDTNGITTGRAQLRLQNSGGGLQLGIEDSTGGSTLSGSAANSAYVGSNSNTPFYLTQNATIRATIDTSGRVGIGSTSDPGGMGARLWIDSTTDSYFTVNTTGSGSVSGINFRNSNANGEARFVNNTGGPLTFYRSVGNEAARIDSSGRLLVGTSSALTGATAQYSKNVNLGNSANAAGNAVLAIGRGAAATSISSGNQIGSVYFTDNGAGEFASIDCFADAAPGTNDYPGRLVFSTTADGASSPTERMRIKANGTTCIGTTTEGTMSGDAVVAIGPNIGIISKRASVAASGTVDININTSGGGYQGFLIVANTNTSNAAIRTHTTFSVFGRGTDSSIQQIATDNGTTSGASFTVTTPSNGVIRVTNTTAATTDVDIQFFGGTSG